MTPATGGCCRAFPRIGHYRIYQLDPSDHITAGFSVECGSDAAAMRAARTLLERSDGVEVWKGDHRVANLSPEARQLWGGLRDGWMASWRA
jgi:hypothetical protein